MKTILLSALLACGLLACLTPPAAAQGRLGYSNPYVYYEIHHAWPGPYPYPYPYSYGWYPYTAEYYNLYNFEQQNLYNNSLAIKNFYHSPSGAIDPIGGEPTPKTTMLPPPLETHGVVAVKVPSAYAQVWFNGQLTNATGVTRVFQTPDLPSGKAFSYTVRADWTQGGEPVSRERTVTVAAGKTAVVDFTK